MFGYHSSSSSTIINVIAVINVIIVIRYRYIEIMNERRISRAISMITSKSDTISV